MNALKRLRQAFPAGEARALYELIVQHRFGLTRTDIVLGKDTTLSAAEQAELEEITERVANSEPVQYVLGFETFCGHAFRVTPDVLIPRPETQELVRIVQQNIPAGSEVLDIGTGSGCIAVSLAVAGYRLTAFDVSEKALQVARENALALGARVDFRCEDILHPSACNGQWDAIVSNPPYICHCEARDMDDNVLLHEPHLALFVPDDNPLVFYNAIADYAAQHLVENGMLFFETNRMYNQQVMQLLIEKKFNNVMACKDQYDNARFVCARKS